MVLRIFLAALAILFAGCVFYVITSYTHAFWHRRAQASLGSLVRAALDDMARNGIRPAGLLVDTIFSSDGVFADPPGFLAPAVDAIHEAGGLFIADEVQPGFARTGDAMWGFQRHGVVPDLVGVQEVSTADPFQTGRVHRRLFGWGERCLDVESSNARHNGVNTQPFILCGAQGYGKTGAKVAPRRFFT